MWSRALADRSTTGSLTPGGDVIRAAGGMIVRRNAVGRIEVAVVHRPLRVDWTFPKGKLEPDESLEEGALREVFEETGYRCRLGPIVGRTEYTHRKGRPKVVVYWLMLPESGTFEPGDEVDELRWLEFDEAAALLTYERDRELLSAVEAAARRILAEEATARSA